MMQLSKWRRWLGGSRVLMLCAVVGASLAHAQSPWRSTFGKDPAQPLPPEQAFTVSARWADARTVHVRFDVTADYYLYRERTLIALKDSPGRRIGALQFQAPVTKNDPNFGPMAVYTKPFEVAVPIEGSAAQPVNLLVQYQGCYETIGVCYPPVTVTIRPR